MIKKLKLYNYDNMPYYIYFILCCLLIAFDRITKSLALSYNFNYIGRFYRLFHLPPLKNTGISLQLFNMTDSKLFFILEIFGFIVIMYFVYLLKKKYDHNDKNMFGEILVISGGIGNLIDRLYYHAVIDFIFIKIPLLNYLAIANVADILISIGCLILALELFSSKN